MSIETTGTRVELTSYGVAYTVRERHFTLDVTAQVLEMLQRQGGGP